MGFFSLFQSHAASHEPAGGDAMAVDAAAATGSLRTLGTGALQAAAGSHSHTTLPTVAYKSADQVVNNSAVLQNDDHIQLDVAANEVWAFSMQLAFHSGTTTPDLKIGWSVPAGTTMKWSYADSGWGQFSESTTRVLAAGSSSDLEPFGGVIIVGAAAGTVRLQWAQNTQTAENTTLEKGSHAVFTRLA